MALIQTAFNQGLITADGHDWLLAFGWCPMLIDLGTGAQIIEFCPLN